MNLNLQLDLARHPKNNENLHNSLINNNIEKSPIEFTKNEYFPQIHLPDIKKYNFFSILKKGFFRSFRIFRKPAKITREIIPHKQSSTKNTRKFIKYVQTVMMVLKAIKLFKWRSNRLRNLSFVNERQITLINDASHIDQISLVKGKFFFIKNKFIRIKILILKKKFKQFLVYSRKKKLINFSDKI